MKALNGHHLAAECAKNETIRGFHSNSLTRAHSQFINRLLFHDPRELSASLKRIHNIALYHSNISLAEEEKAALYDLKILWESLGDVMS